MLLYNVYKKKSKEFNKDCIFFILIKILLLESFFIVLRNNMRKMYFLLD